MDGKPVVLINAFEVPVGDDEAFLSGWQRARDFLSTQPGYLGVALHRSLAGDAEFRFVNVAHWASREDFLAAVGQPEFRDATFPWPFHAALYAVVASDAADAELERDETRVGAG